MGNLFTTIIIYVHNLSLLYSVDMIPFRIKHQNESPQLKNPRIINNATKWKTTKGNQLTGKMLWSL